MIAASLVKELKLLSRDLHGLAVLFVMPITFMLIMSVALSRDADPHHGSRIALVGVADDAVNKQFAAGLAKDDIQVTLMQPEKLDDAQSGLHWFCTIPTVPPTSSPTANPCRFMSRPIPSLRGWRR